MPRTSLVAGLLGLALVGPAHALEFGHARVLSRAGQPLRADIALTQLSTQELADVQVRIAPEMAWRQAGLTPPVDLSSLQVRVIAGLTSDARVARLSSEQIFAHTVADFLIDVQTTMGMRRHQVSVLVQRRALVLPDSAGDPQPVTRLAGITVRRGDTLFAVAHAHAVSGLSVYQMMAALFYVNADAFIDGNMNRVKAGAVLRLPDAAVLSRLTDRQARQLFAQHARAYAQRRGHGAAADGLETVIGLTPATDASFMETVQAHITPSSQDQLQLRVDDVGTQRTDDAVALAADSPQQTGDTRAARGAVQDSLAHIAQLEENIQELNQVLQELASPPDAQTATVGHGIALPGIAPSPGVPGTETTAAVASGASTAQSHAASTAPSVEPGNTVFAPVLPAPQTPTQGSGLMNTMWMMIAAGVALLVLLIVWLRRRTRVAQSAGGKITDAMIQEKLTTIDLSLDQDDPPQRRS